MDSYNPTATTGVMYRNTLSVSWYGFLFGCDFNHWLVLLTLPSASQLLPLNASGH
ncbi:MAG: DUF3641 domain-containing protein [Bacteroidetes bacterium]|nr:DUF3641 domain-containing protein [Bacteroidota bacterium]